jgi:hypothetical protein
MPAETIESDRGPVCPYCGHCHEEVETWEAHVSYWGTDGGTREFQCVECELTFAVGEIVTRTWKSRPVIQAAAQQQ